MSNEFRIQGVAFEFLFGKYDEKSTPDRIVLLKPKAVLDHYSKLIPTHKPSIIFEVGIFEAGSAIALALLNPLAKIIAIDILKKPYLDEIVSYYGLQDRVRLYHGVDQRDEKTIKAIIERETAGAPLDLVIDDGSHMYEFSRDSFEIIFPYIKRGGIYVLEDWNWAHYSGEYQSTKWMDKPALTNLVFELAMMAGSSSPDVHLVEIRGISALVSKKSEFNGGKRLHIDNHIRARGKKITLI